MARRRVLCIIHGMVQGVGYRYQVCGFAKKQGIGGFVRNRHDGSVEIVAEGDEGALRELIWFCYNGIEHAHVKSVDETWEEYSGSLKEFHVER